MKRTPLRRKSPLRWKTGNAKTRAGMDRLAAAKAEVRGRSGGWCEVQSPACPLERHPAHHAHHVVPRSRGGLHEPENLLDVCGPAHDWIHRNPTEATARGWLGRRAA